MAVVGNLSPSVLLNYVRCTSASGEVKGDEASQQGSRSSVLDETLSVTSRLASSVRRYRVPTARPSYWNERRCFLAHSFSDGSRSSFSLTG